MSFNSLTIDQAQKAPIQKPVYFTQEFNVSSSTQQLIEELGLIGHREGGFFNETDRSPFYMENPHFQSQDQHLTKSITSIEGLERDQYRNYSTLIYYLLTPQIPYGRFHKNLNRIIHILQKGRGQYVLIHPDGTVKSFVVGFNHSKGEVSQWVVPGGVWKASFLLPLGDKADEDDHLMISEVVVPGFEYDDHKFLENDQLLQLVGEERARELSFLQHASS
jgi:predicted cupin superfamily sugar epimerase